MNNEIDNAKENQKGIKEIEAILEAVLFSAGDTVSLEKLSEIVELDRKTTKAVMDRLISTYKNQDRGLLLREINGKYQLCTKPEYGRYIKQLVESRQKQPLSQAALETLAIVAYNGPVTRARIEYIRGSNSDSAVLRLVERGLIHESGRMEAPGRPLLYEVTDEFLRSYGYSSVKELPVLSMELADGS